MKEAFPTIAVAKALWCTFLWIGQNLLWFQSSGMHLSDSSSPRYMNFSLVSHRHPTLCYFLSQPIVSSLYSLYSNSSLMSCCWCVISEKRNACRMSICCYFRIFDDESSLCFLTGVPCCTKMDAYLRCKKKVFWVDPLNVRTSETLINSVARFSIRGMVHSERNLVQQTTINTIFRVPASSISFNPVPKISSRRLNIRPNHKALIFIMAETAVIVGLQT